MPVWVWSWVWEVTGRTHTSMEGLRLRAASLLAGARASAERLRRALRLGAAACAVSAVPLTPLLRGGLARLLLALRGGECGVRLLDGRFEQRHRSAALAVDVLASYAHPIALMAESSIGSPISCPST